MRVVNITRTNEGLTNQPTNQVEVSGSTLGRVNASCREVETEEMVKKKK